MNGRSELELLYLHALPFGGAMWAGQRGLFSGRQHMPTLYGVGDNLNDWARAAIAPLVGDRLVVIGCSVGGSCALEVAALIPDRIAALVLIGTKAQHRPEPAFRAEATELLRTGGTELGWTKYWAPLFSETTDPAIVARARAQALEIEAAHVINGVAAFHSRISRHGTLASLACPVLMICGAEDVAPGVATMRQQALSARDGRFRVVPDCGHYVSIERPAALNVILQDLLTDLERRRP